MTIDLNEILSDRDAHNDHHYVFIDSIACQNESESGSVSLSFILSLGKPVSSRFQIIGEEVVINTVAPGRQDGELQLFDKHQFLDALHEPRFELYFSSKPESPSRLMGSLAVSYETMPWPRIPYSDLIGFWSHHHIENYFKSSMGLVATGPKSVIDRFKLVLDQEQIESSLLPDHNDEIRLANKYVALPDSLQLLVINGGFAVARKFIVSDL